MIVLSIRLESNIFLLYGKCFINNVYNNLESFLHYTIIIYHVYTYSEWDFYGDGKISFIKTQFSPKLYQIFVLEIKINPGNLKGTITLLFDRRPISTNRRRLSLIIVELITKTSEIGPKLY